MKRTIAVPFVLCIVGILVSMAMLQIEPPQPAQPSTSKYPQRIICGAPNIAEVIYALEEQDRIVGVSDYTYYPPESEEKPRIGGLINPNFERILSLKPDLIILQGSMEKHTAFCREHGINVVRVDMENLQSIYDGIQTIGQALGCVKKADSLNQDIQQRIQAIRIKAAQHHQRPKVFICLFRRTGALAGLFSVNQESFLHELLQVAGGENIFYDAMGRYPQISKESLLIRAPDVIVEIKTQKEISIGQIKTVWQAMPNLPAVASGRIYLITDEYMMISGPRVYQIAERFYTTIHQPDEAKF